MNKLLFVGLLLMSGLVYSSDVNDSDRQNVNIEFIDILDNLGSIVDIGNAVALMDYRVDVIGAHRNFVRARDVTTRDADTDIDEAIDQADLALIAWYHAHNKYQIALANIFITNN